MSSVIPGSAINKVTAMFELTASSDELGTRVIDP